MPDKTEMMTEALARVDGDAEWLCEQLERWPKRVHEDRTTNITYLMECAAKLLRATLAPPAAVDPDVERAARLVLADEHDRSGDPVFAEILRGDSPLDPTGPHAVTIRAMVAFAAIRPPAAAPYVPSTGDFRCHNCKHVVTAVVAPGRCPKCRCRDFSACS